MKFSLAVVQSTFIGAIDDPNDAVGRFEVVSPVGTKRFLSSDVPYVQFEAETSRSNASVVRESTYFLCSNVLMLNPSVGDIVLMSSPLNRLRIVVFPALSSPLRHLRDGECCEINRSVVLQHEKTHFFLFLSHFLQNR